MNIQDLISFQDTFFLFKIGVLVVILFYAIFSFVIFTQVQAMNRIITLSPFSRLVALFALLQLFASLSLFLAAVVIL